MNLCRYARFQRSIPYLYTMTMMGLLLFPLCMAWLHQRDLHDDAYITLTYAKNLAEGRGFVYNHPPASLGTTTPLYTFLLATVGWLFPSLALDTASRFIAGLCWALAASVFVIFRRTWSLSIVDAVTITSVLTLFGSYYGLGMEAQLFALLLLVSCTFIFSRKYFLAGISIGLLFLTRGEGILLAAIIPIWLLLKYPRVAYRRPWLWIQANLYAGLGVLAIIVPWCIYAIYTFGVIVPDTLDAKLIQSTLGLKEFGTVIPTRFLVWGSFLPGFAFLTWVYNGVAILGLLAILLGKSRLLLPLSWGFLYALAYTALSVPYYWWYAIPIYNCWILCIGFGMCWILKRATNRPPPLRWVLRSVVALLLLTMAAQTVTLVTTSKGYRKAPVYLAATDWLRENASDDALVATAEVGYPGFYLDNPILDLWGLTTPQVIEHLRARRFDAVFWLRMPDYYIAMDNDLPWHRLRDDPRFDKRYEAQVQFAAPEPWGTCTVYQRKP